MIDSNLANGLVYFNCFPNFSMNINDPSILSSLTLNIKTKNMNFVEETQTITIIYRIYYKGMTTQLNPRVVCQSVKDETLLLQYNPNNTQAFVPKKLKWNEITQGGQWELKDLTHPKPIIPLTTSSKIIQHTNGIVQIEFSPTSRYSFNQDFMFTRSSTSNTNLNGVDFTPKIPIPVYQQQESPPMSPTHSDMYPNVEWIKSNYFSPYKIFITIIKSTLFTRKIIKRLILLLM